MLANLFERWTMRQTLDIRVIIVQFRQFRVWNGAVSSVACEVDLLAARFDAPACPESLALVEGRSCGDVLIWKARYCGCDARVGGRGCIGGRDTALR